MAELVIKGDSTLEQIFPPRDEQPDWATFDEDLGDDDEPPADLPDGDRRAEGRFALYTAPDSADSPTRPVSNRTKKPGAKSVAAPEVADELDYESLTLAQLRARLQTLDVDELEALLAYEEATKARAPFQTLLANRITRATAK
jgi:hypothetical protein